MGSWTLVAGGIATLPHHHYEFLPVCRLLCRSVAKYCIYISQCFCPFPTVDGFSSSSLLSVCTQSHNHPIHSSIYAFHVDICLPTTFTAAKLKELLVYVIVAIFYYYFLVLYFVVVVFIFLQEGNLKDSERANQNRVTNFSVWGINIKI